MIKNFIYLYNIILLFMPVIGFSCDFCSVVDYSTVTSQSYIGLNYRYSLFNGYNTFQHDHNFTLLPHQNLRKHFTKNPSFSQIENQRDYELFQVIELQANIQVKEKYMVTLSVPYVSNSDYYATLIPQVGAPLDTLVYNSGLGDITVRIAKRRLVERDISTHVFTYGGGVSLPTGRFEIDETKLTGDPRHQPGTGAFTLLATAAYSATFQSRFGVWSNFSYSYSTKSSEKKGGGVVNGNVIPLSQEYRFGNRFNNITHGFWVFRFEKIKLFPLLGFQVDHWGQDVRSGEEVKSTGSTRLLLSGGIDVRVSKLIFRTTLAGPLYQKHGGQQIEQAGIYNCSLIYLLGKS